MVMIRENAPGIHASRKLRARIQQCAFTFSHSFRSDSDYVFVLVTRAGDHELKKTREFPMRGRVPGTLAQATIFDRLTSLLARHFTIVIPSYLEQRRIEYRL